MESPYQSLTGFHLGLQEKQYHDYLFNRVAQQHPTFTRAQIEGVLDGSIGASGSPTEAPMDEGDSQEPGWTFTPPATSPSGSAAAASKTASPTSMSKWPQQDIDQYRQLQEAARQYTMAAYSSSQTDGGNKKSLLDEAQKASDEADALREQNKDIGKPPVDNIPTADTPDAVAALPYGSRYWSNGHLFQSFSPTQGQGTITINGQVQDSGETPDSDEAPPATPPLFAFGQQPLSIPPLSNPNIPLSPYAPPSTGIFGQWLSQSDEIPTGTPAALPAAAPAADDIPTGTPAAWTAAAAAPAADDVPMIQSQSQYDILPVGAKYRDSTGKLAIKLKR